MSHTPTPSDAEVDKHLDAVLRATGSALRHYTMQKSKDDMRAAMRAAMSIPPLNKSRTNTMNSAPATVIAQTQIHVDRLVDSVTYLEKEVSDLERELASARARLSSAVRNRDEAMQWLAEQGAKSSHAQPQKAADGR